ncbi:DEAD-box ATP-dependent RNA helicase 38-like [Rutidosis leptorrhynchoides]|uniref:DEAD-box ATP-dependent RNA helicase 38-like n=1 Tax=Rutidosis leptorrhynchoides TaxID=125765 RepID=UPI003A997947
MAAADDNGVTDMAIVKKRRRHTAVCIVALEVQTGMTMDVAGEEVGCPGTVEIVLNSSNQVDCGRDWGRGQGFGTRVPTAITSSSVTTMKLDSLSTGGSSNNLNNYVPYDSNVQAVTAGDTPYTSAMRFEDLNISHELLKGLYIEMKFERPSKIQSISLPMIMTPPFKGLIAQAHNGSGKTTCFVLGMLSRVEPKLDAPQALCICPTRELAMQNMEVLKKMGKFTGITSELAIADRENPISVFKRAPVTAQVVIGTTGTVNKWIAAKKLGTAYMKILVFDEASHRCSESGFRDNTVRIMKDIVKWSPNCQLYVNKEDLSLDSIKQYKVRVPDELSKIMLIKDNIFDIGEAVKQTIIFVRTRNSAGMLHGALVKYGLEVTTIQGSLTDKDRDKIIKEFKEGYTHVLISTDLLAEGLIKLSHKGAYQVNLVVNYDLPVRHESPSEPDYEVYLHRIGRVGRFGRKV